MLQHLLRFRFVAQRSSKSIVNQFLNIKSGNGATKSGPKNYNNTIKIIEVSKAPRFACSFLPGPAQCIRQYSSKNSLTTQQDIEEQLKWLVRYPDIFEQLWNSIRSSPTESYESCRPIFEAGLKLFPNNYTVRMSHAMVLYGYNMDEEAEAELHKAIAIDSQKCKPWTILWVVNPSILIYRQKAMNCPDADKVPLLWTHNAKLLIQDEDFDAAFESLKKALAAQKPVPLIVERELADMFMKLRLKGDLDMQEALVDVWMEAAPLSPNVWLFKGSVYQDCNNYPEAKNCYKKATELDPNYAEAWLNYGNLLPPNEGIPILLKSIELNPNVALTHSVLAGFYLNVGEPQKALDSVNRSLQLNDKDKQTLKLKVQICSILKLWREELLAAYDYYYKPLDESDWRMMANLHFLEQRFDKALELARDQDPSNFIARVEEIEALLALNRFEEGLQVIEKAIELTKDDRDRYFSLMNYKSILLAKLGQFEEAKTLIDMLKQTFNPKTTFSNLGGEAQAIIDVQEGNYDKALDYYTRYFFAMEYNNRFMLERFGVFLSVAKIHDAKGDLDKAEMYYQRVVDINPAVKVAQERLKAIRMQKKR